MTKTQNLHQFHTAHVKQSSRQWAGARWLWKLRIIEGSLVISGRDRPTNLNKPKILEEIISLYFNSMFFRTKFWTYIFGILFEILPSNWRRKLWLKNDLVEEGGVREKVIIRKFEVFGVGWWLALVFPSSVRLFNKKPIFWDAEPGTWRKPLELLLTESPVFYDFLSSIS